MRHLFAGLVAAGVLLFSFDADAGYDTFGTGSGRNGAINVTTNTVVNAYGQLNSPIQPPDAALVLRNGTTGFGAGDLVLIVQSTGYGNNPSSGLPGPWDLSNDSVGRFELARVSSKNASTLFLATPVTQAFPGISTQVVRVPEYTDVTVTSPARIVAQPWDGTVGGIVAFLASGTVAGSGSIGADNAGFRGGVAMVDDTGAVGCTNLDQALPAGARKGEGLQRTRYDDPANGSDSAFSGRGQVINAGGGGVCLAAGGGGGGLGGAGGKGGRSNDGSRDAGGLGGGVVTFDASERLLFGGGGGAGHATSGATGSSGAQGAGAVFIRANAINLGGFITASAYRSATAAEFGDAGGGGGAGGTVHVRSVGAFTAAGVFAHGGLGANAEGASYGPGGGGGGGRVFVQASAVTANTQAIGANPGVQADVVAPAYGATAGANGTVTTVASGYVASVEVSLVTPASNALTNNPRPIVSGSATAGATVYVQVDGLGAGFVTADATGNWTLVPTDDVGNGAHVVAARAQLAGASSSTVTRTFSVDTVAPDTTITSAPPVLTNSRRIEFTVASNDAGATFVCQIDTSTLPACVNPVVLDNAPDGTYVFAARARDGAGNVDATPATWTFTVDGTPPPAPIVALPAEGETLDTTAVTVGGSAEPGAVVALVLDSVAIGSATADAGGLWMFDVPGPIGSGPHLLVATARDAAGNTGPGTVRNFTIELADALHEDGFEDEPAPQ